MKNNPVVWFEIYVQDIARAKQFYESVFQVQLERLASTEHEMWSFPMDMESTGAAGALIRMDGVPSGGNSTLIYFACEDCAVEQGRAAESGGQVEREKMAIGEYGFISLVRDTEGNLIGLHSMSEGG